MELLENILAVLVLSGAIAVLTAWLAVCIIEFGTSPPRLTKYVGELGRKDQIFLCMMVYGTIVVPICGPLLALIHLFSLL